MAYYSGTANSANDLLNAIRTSAQSDGWTLTGNVLSKGTLFVEHVVSGANVKIRAGTDGTMVNSSQSMSIGKFLKTNTLAITYPCNWEFHGHPQEVYFVVRYDVDRYQWMAWGKSTVAGLPGVGTWLSASVGHPLDEIAVPNYDFQPITLYFSGSVFGGGGSYASSTGYVTAALWAHTQTTEGTNYAPGYCHHDLDGYGWRIEMSSSSSYSPPGWNTIGAIYGGAQPSAWNAEAALLPLRLYSRRPSNRISLIVDHEHARLLRIDNLTPGDVLTLGPDKWKVYPWHRKNVASRNGSNGIDHTGTFGWAVRYLGP